MAEPSWICIARRNIRGITRHICKIDHTTTVRTSILPRVALEYGQT
jgi:hypothetical protein